MSELMRKKKLITDSAIGSKNVLTASIFNLYCIYVRMGIDID